MKALYTHTYVSNSFCNKKALYTHIGMKALYYVSNSFCDMKALDNMKAHITYVSNSFCKMKALYTHIMCLIAFVTWKHNRHI